MCAKEGTKLQISSVDGFQGKDNKIIIISCVCSNCSQKIGDPLRPNVMLTRAMDYLFIFGNKETLSGNDHFNNLFKNININKT